MMRVCNVAVCAARLIVGFRFIGCVRQVAYTGEDKIIERSYCFLVQGVVLVSTKKNILGKK